jgi:hypothetical protein
MADACPKLLRSPLEIRRPERVVRPLLHIAAQGGNQEIAALLDFRQAIDRWVLNTQVLYWLDLGNNASSGQFVLGQPKNSANRKKKRLPTVTELYPEILKRDKQEDDEPSCSAAEALTRQEPFINQNLAYQALGMLTQLLRHGSVSYQGGFCNLATGRLTPLPIRAPQRAHSGLHWVNRRHDSVVNDDKDV